MLLLLLLLLLLTAFISVRVAGGVVHGLAQFTGFQEGGHDGAAATNTNTANTTTPQGSEQWLSEAATGGSTPLPATQSQSGRRTHAVSLCIVHVQCDREGSKTRPITQRETRLQPAEQSSTRTAAPQSINNQHVHSAAPLNADNNAVTAGKRTLFTPTGSR